MAHSTVEVFSIFIGRRNDEKSSLPGPKDALVPADSFWSSVDLEDADTMCRSKVLPSAMTLALASAVFCCERCESSYCCCTLLSS
ncbi:hypothetical protein OROMI_028979 [Orobanche minor]